MESGSGACHGCGAPLPSDAAFCAKCGRRRPDAAPTQVELTPLGPSAAASVVARAMRDEQTAVVAMRRPDQRRALVVLAAVVATGLLAVAIAGLVLDDADGAAAPATTTAAASGSASGASAATTTSASPTTSSSRAVDDGAPATPPTLRPLGPVLDAAQSGWSVYVSDGTVIRRLDLATGLADQRALGPQVGDFEMIGVVAGRLVFDSVDGGVRSVAANLTGEVRVHPIWQPGGRGSLLTAGDLLWSIRYDERAASSIAGLTDLDADIKAAMIIPQVDYPVGFVGERALIVRGGRTYTLGVSGTYELYANGEALAAHNGFVLWVGCDDTARCAHHVSDATGQDLGITSLPATRHLRIARQQQGLAPDGQSAITLTGQGTALALVRLTTGTETALPPDVEATAWTPDGSWLVMYGAGQLFALNVRDGRIHSFDLGIADARRATIGLVVG